MQGEYITKVTTVGAPKEKIFVFEKLDQFVVPILKRIIIE